MLTLAYRVCRPMIAACAMIAVMLIALSISFQFFRSSKPAAPAAEPTSQTTTGTFTIKEEHQGSDNATTAAETALVRTGSDPANPVEHTQRTSTADEFKPAHPQAPRHHAIAPTPAENTQHQDTTTKPDAWGAIKRFDDGARENKRQQQNPTPNEHAAQRTLKRLINDF